jgi:DNA-binding response OmpR family regulator
MLFKELIHMKNLLIIENDESNKKLYQYLFRTRDLKITFANNADEARISVKEIDPEIIILEPYILSIRNFQFAQELRSLTKNRNTKIITITSYAHEKDKNTILQQGSNYFFSKPFNIHEIISLTEILIKN